MDDEENQVNDQFIMIIFVNCLIYVLIIKLII